MSGEKEKDVSSWTTDSLKAHLQLEIDNLRIMLDSRFAAEQIAIRSHTQTELDVLRQRFTDIDRATELLNSQVTQVPTDVDKQVGHLKALHDERFSSVQQQFKERDTRSERESRDNKVAVDAAFAAQKEAASEQNKSNTLTISKSETATAETINKLSELFQTSNKALEDKIDDIKKNEARLESRLDLSQGKSSGVNAAYVALAGFISLAATIITIVLALNR